MYVRICLVIRRKAEGLKKCVASGTMTAVARSVVFTMGEVLGFFVFFDDTKEILLLGIVQWGK